jgi:hypothetical protein
MKKCFIFFFSPLPAPPHTTTTTTTTTTFSTTSSSPHWQHTNARGRGVAPEDLALAQPSRWWWAW